MYIRLFFHIAKTETNKQTRKSIYILVKQIVPHNKLWWTALLRTWVSPHDRALERNLQPIQGDPTSEGPGACNLFVLS